MEILFQTLRYEGTRQLWDIMPTIAYERATLAALVSSETITIRHERPIGTGQFHSIWLQMTRPYHIFTKPASSSFVRRFLDSASFFAHNRPAVLSRPIAAHKRCHLVFRGACNTGPPILPRPHPPSSSPLQISDHKFFYAALPPPHSQWTHPLPVSVSQALALRSVGGLLWLLAVASRLQRSADRSTTNIHFPSRTHL